MYGKYEECGILFVGEMEIEGFYTLQGGEYQKRIFTKEKGWGSHAAVDFLLLSVDEEEQRKLKATCEACVAAHKPFNLYDVLMMFVPFVNPKEISVFEAETLNNTQAVVLILRECLSSNNPLRLALEGLHSRQTFAITLYERLSPHSLSVMWSSLLGQLRA